LGIKNGLEMSKFILNLQIGMCIITKEMKPENVILHVVWEHDSEILEKNTEIPVLELKNM
jgi:hypothetical protein